MINQFTSSSTDVITGKSENCEVLIGVPTRAFLTTDDFEFATITAAKTESEWVDGITEESILPIPDILEYTDNSEDDTYWVSPVNSVAKFIREGKTDNRIMCLFEPGLYRRLRGLNGKKMRLFYADGAGNVMGTSPDNTVIKGVSLGTLRVEKWIHSTGDNPTFIPIRFVMDSGIERNDQVAMFNVTWNINSLNGIQPLSLTVVGTPSSTSVVVDIEGTDDGVALEGLTLPAQFSFIKASDGSSQTISTVTESTTVPGRYTLAGTGLVTGSLNIKDVITLAGAYYKGTAVTVTIS